MSLEKKIPIIVLSIILFSYGIGMSTSEVYADSHNIPPISVSTDSEKYADGDTIIMTVNIRDYDPSSGHVFTWLIKSTDNEDVAIGQLVPSYDGSFQVTIVAGGPLWELSGDYIIEFRYGSDSGETTIVYTGGNAPGGIQNSITVTTDKASYSEGEVVLITGEVRDLYSGTPASVTVLHPDGSLVSLSQVSVGYDKKFSTEIVAGGALMDIAGTYSVVAQYGNASRSAETTFFYKTAPTNISFTNPRTVDAFGNSLDTVYVDQQVQITSDIFNNNNFSQDFFIYHITIRETGLEAWIWGSLSPYQIFSPAVSWIPTEPGIFTVDISLFDNMENKNKLSESLTLQIFVEESTLEPKVTITATTIKQTYENGDTAIINGKILNYDPVSAYSFISSITSPDNNIVKIQQVFPDWDGTFSHIFKVGGRLWESSGDYIITYNFGLSSEIFKFNYKAGEGEVVTISAKTNYSSYTDGDVVRISGIVNPVLEHKDFTYVVISPDDKTITLGQSTPSSDGTFSFSFVVGGVIWESYGEYIIKLQYGTASTKISINFIVDGDFPEPTPYPTPTYDTTPPKILKPTDIVVDAKNQHGARVFYNVLAIDETDQIVQPLCDPSSGSLFKVGETRIICNARDSSGNRATPISFYVTVNSPILIPNWVKEVATVWCNDGISDESFIEAVQYLIENGVITVPLNSDSNVETGKTIPDWIKNNACWWSENLISDDDFASGLEYLVQQGIIKV